MDVSDPTAPFMSRTVNGSGFDDQAPSQCNGLSVASNGLAVLTDGLNYIYLYNFTDVNFPTGVTAFDMGLIVGKQ